MSFLTVTSPVLQELASRMTLVAGASIAGLCLLLMGLTRRARSRRRYPAPPMPYPPRFGHPPPPQQPGYPPGFPPPPPPGFLSPPPERSGTGLAIAGAAVLALALLGGVVGIARSGILAGLRVGQCITSEDFAYGRVDAAPIDCRRTDALYEVVAAGGSAATCPDGRREGTDYNTLISHTGVVCFIPNIKEGQCIATAAGNGVVNEAEALIRCDAPSRKIQVVQRTDARNKNSKCPLGTETVGYLSSPRIYCVRVLDPGP